MWMRRFSSVGTIQLSFIRRASRQIYVEKSSPVAENSDTEDARVTSEVPQV
jgi:hypothetical protein